MREIPPLQRHALRLIEIAQVVPHRRQLAPGRPSGSARAFARIVRGVLGALGGAMGVPGVAQGSSRRRRFRSGSPFRECCGALAVVRIFTADDLGDAPPEGSGEAELARRGLPDREVKRGRGGIRDIEFAVQLLQLVHGRLDPDLRSPTTLTSLDELSNRVCRRGRRSAPRRGLPISPMRRAPAPAARRHTGARHASRR